MGRNPYGFLQKAKMFSLFLPPKTVSAVHLYGDEAVFDASASFLSLRERLVTSYVVFSLPQYRNSVSRYGEDNFAFSVRAFLIQQSSAEPPLPSTEFSKTHLITIIEFCWDNHRQTEREP